MTEALFGIVVAELASVLQPLGYEQLRRAFRRRTELGDYGVIDAQNSEGDSGECLAWYVNLAVMPEPYLDGIGYEPPQVAGGAWRTRLIPPAGAGDAVTKRWIAEGPDSVREIAVVMLEHVKAEALPWIDARLNRDSFLELARADNDRTGIVVALVDQGLSSELEEAIEGIERRRPGSEFAAWARARAVAAASNTH